MAEKAGFARLRGLIMHYLMKRTVDQRHLGTYTEQSWEATAPVTTGKGTRASWLARKQWWGSFALSALSSCPLCHVTNCLQDTWTMVEDEGKIEDSCECELDSDS